MLLRAMTLHHMWLNPMSARGNSFGKELWKLLQYCQTYESLTGRATIPSGSLTLDIALGGGIPRGRIIEVTHLTLGKRKRD